MKKYIPAIAIAVVAIILVIVLCVVKFSNKTDTEDSTDAAVTEITDETNTVAEVTVTEDSDEVVAEEGASSSQSAATTTMTTVAYQKVANPVTEYQSLAALNKAAGTNMVEPGVMGVTDESFTTVKTSEYTIADYSFKVNGVMYTLRAAHTTEDITGLYTTGGTIYEGKDKSTQFVSGTGYRGYRWFDGNLQYVLTTYTYDNSDVAVDDDTFKGIAQEMESNISG